MVMSLNWFQRALTSLLWDPVELNDYQRFTGFLGTVTASQWALAG